MENPQAVSVSSDKIDNCETTENETEQLLMASSFFRKRRKQKVLTSKFPCKLHMKRLSKVTDLKDIGVFTVDKCRFIIEEYWTVEDFPGVKRSYRQYKPDGSPNGYLHLVTYLGHDYQIYQGKGANRVILINPRHFKSFYEFKNFASKVLQDKPYRISGVDLSWMLYKEFFSIDFLFWCLWYKGASVQEPVPARSQIDKVLSKCAWKEFGFGRKPIVGKAYDCDAHNEDKIRPERWKMHGCVNLELALGNLAVGSLGVQTLEDLEKFDFISDALKKIEFIEPSKTCFRNTQFEDLYLHWETFGATSMMRELNKVSGTNNYDRLSTSYMKALLIGSEPAADALKRLATDDWKRFKNGRLGRFRYPIRHVGYDMTPLFS